VIKSKAVGMMAIPITGKIIMHRKIKGGRQCFDGKTSKNDILQHSASYMTAKTSTTSSTMPPSEAELETKIFAGREIIKESIHLCHMMVHLD